MRQHGFAFRLVRNRPMLEIVHILLKIVADIADRPKSLMNNDSGVNRHRHLARVLIGLFQRVALINRVRQLAYLRLEIPFAPFTRKLYRIQSVLCDLGDIHHLGNHLLHTPSFAFRIHSHIAHDPVFCRFVRKILHHLHINRVE